MDLHALATEFSRTDWWHIAFWALAVFGICGWVYSN